MNTVTIDTARGVLVVEPRGMDKVLGLVRRIEVPLDEVRGATHDPGAAEERKGFRAPGLEVPGHRWVGTWRKGHDKHYWNVTGGSDTVVIDLAAERFQRLFLSVENPRAVVDEINAAVAGRSTG